jgi:hypothetical protein
MLNTHNLVKALDWVEYHRNGPEHVAKLIKALPADKLPPIHGTIVSAKMENNV